MAGWAALVVCLALAAARADDYYGYEHDPESWRDISPVAHTTSQEELDAVVSQVLAHDKPEGYLDGYMPESDKDLSAVEVYFEMETKEKSGGHFPEGYHSEGHNHVRYPRHPDSYYHSPLEYLRPVVLARKEYPTLPYGDYYYEEAELPVRHVISKPYRSWSYEPARAVYVDNYKPLYVEKPRFRESDLLDTRELLEHKDGAWPGDYIDRKAVLIEKAVDAGIKPLPYKHVLVEPHHRPIISKEYFDYGYGPHVAGKEVLVPLKNFHGRPYVIERLGDDKEEFETDTVHIRDGPEGKEIVEVDKDVRTDVDKKIIVQPIVTEDGIETIIAEEEDRDVSEDVQESVHHLHSPYDMRE